MGLGYYNGKFFELWGVAIIMPYFGKMGLVYNNARIWNIGT